MVTVALTDKEDTYCQLRALHGKKKYEAYASAYTVSPDTPKKSLYEMASHLEANVKIKSRIAELRAMVKEATIQPAIADLVEREIHATNVMRSADATIRDQLHANKLIGEYEKDLGPATTPVPPGNTYNNVFINWPMESLGELLSYFKDGTMRAFAEANRDGNFQAWVDSRALGDGSSTIQG